MSIKAVIFDLDGTLVERSLNDSEAFHKILEQKGLQLPVGEVKRAYCEVTRKWGHTFLDQRGKISRLEYHRLWCFHLLKVLGIEDHNEDIVREVTDGWINVSGITARRGAKLMLTDVRCKRLKTGIVSGNYEEEIRTMLEIAGLDEVFFDVVVGTDTIKKRKPDPEVFRYALRELGVKPEETMYVGDDLESDYKAAERVGMKPFLIVKSEDGAPENVRKIRNLMSLIDYLD